MLTRHATAVLVLLTTLSAVSLQSAESPQTLEIRVEGTDWNAPPEDVRAVLESAGAQILRYVPDRRLEPIVVRRGGDVPMTFDEKGPGGEYRVRLACDSTYWAQYSYQFAHELCHVLANYDRHHGGRNQWFEEALCETASLFALSRMHEAWKEAPPYPNWRDWGVHFDEYLNALLADRKRRLPPDRTMPAWLGENLPTLETERHLTDRSKLVAAYLLPLFQDDPRGWETLNALNLGPDDDKLEFRQYLEGWRSRVPADRKAFVEKIEALFGFNALPTTTPAEGR